MVFNFLAQTLGDSNIMPRSLTFIPSLPIFLSFIFVQSNGEDETYVSCIPSKCGDHEIKYPFWLRNDPGPDVQYCGYKGLGLYCSSSSTFLTKDQLILQLADDDFYVNDINYQTRTVTLADINATTNQFCPRPRHNLTLEDLPLGYSAVDWNVNFYFNCTASPLPPLITPTSAVDCLRSGGKMSYVSFWETNKYEGTNDFEWFKVCEQKVVAPVIKEISFNGNPDWVKYLGGALKKGFVLDWSNETEIDCASCESTGGRCGFKNTDNEFLCFSNDGTIKHDGWKGASSFLVKR